MELTQISGVSRREPPIIIKLHSVYDIETTHVTQPKILQGRMRPRVKKDISSFFKFQTLTFAKVSLKFSHFLVTGQSKMSKYLSKNY